MDVALVAAGGACLALAVGHTVIGWWWVLPGVRADDLPPTPFGDRSLTEVFVRFSWYVVSVAVAGLGVLLLVVGGDGLDADGIRAVRVVGAVFAGLTLMVVWSVRRRPLTFVQAPMWLLFVLAAVLCLVVV